MDVTVVSPSLFESSDIEYLNIGKNIVSFDYKTASENMSSLKEIVVTGSNRVYASREGVLFSKNLSELLVYPMAKQDQMFILPAQTTTYDQKETFNNRNLTFIDVEKDNPVYSSYDGVIYSKNKSIILTIPEGKDRMNVLGSVKLDNIAFGFKENLKTVMLEEGITEIPNYTFNGCRGLKELYIPKTVTNIGEDAIYDVNYKQFTIFGETGSEAERFAKAKGIAFVSLNISAKIEELNLLISKAKSLLTENVQENLLKKLNDSINAGEALLDKNDITLPEIEEVIHELSTAIKNVELDKTELQYLLSNVVTNFDAYTEESVKIYQNAIKNATKVLENKDATKEEIKEAIHTLKTVTLVKKIYTVVIDGNVVTVEYGEKLNPPKAPTKEGFTFVGWYAGNKAYDFSEPVKSNLIIEARFTKKEEEKVVDKTELQDLVKNAITEFNGYTAESVKAYKKALCFAQEVLANDSATVDEVVMAIQGLEKAILVKNEDSIAQNNSENNMKPESSNNQNEDLGTVEENSHSKVPNTGVGMVMNHFVAIIGTAMAGIYASTKKINRK